MRFRTTSLAVAALLLVAIGLTACTAKQTEHPSSDPVQPTVEQILDRTRLAMGEITSYRIRGAIFDRDSTSAEFSVGHRNFSEVHRGRKGGPLHPKHLRHRRCPDNVPVRVRQPRPGQGRERRGRTALHRNRGGPRPDTVVGSSGWPERPNARRTVNRPSGVFRFWWAVNWPATLTIRQRDRRCRWPRRCPK